MVFLLSLSIDVHEWELVVVVVNWFGAVVAVADWCWLLSLSIGLVLVVVAVDWCWLLSLSIGLVSVVVVVGWCWLVLLLLLLSIGVGCCRC